MVSVTEGYPGRTPNFNCLQYRQFRGNKSGRPRLQGMESLPPRRGAGPGPGAALPVDGRGRATRWDLGAGTHGVFREGWDPAVGTKRAHRARVGTVQCSLFVHGRDTRHVTARHGWTAGHSNLNAYNTVQSFKHTF